MRYGDAGCLGSGSDHERVKTSTKPTVGDLLEKEQSRRGVVVQAFDGSERAGFGRWVVGRCRAPG